MSLCQKCANANCNHAVEPGEIVVQCGAYKSPMTNADRIRSMSDEEMAEFISSIPMCVGKDEDLNCEIDRCKECFLKWLQKPAEVVDNA